MCHMKIFVLLVRIIVLHRNNLLLKIYSLNITILNVHLCGGRNDDKSFFRNFRNDDDYIKSRSLNIANFNIEPKIDIICGDFNGDMDQKHYAVKTNDYITDIAKVYNCGDKYYEWINLPFTEIKKNNNKTNPNSKIKTTIFGTIVDYIFYDPSTIKEVNYEPVYLINPKRTAYGNINQILGESLSDHNGLLMSFKIDTISDYKQIF